MAPLTKTSSNARNLANTISTLTQGATRPSLDQLTPLFSPTATLSYEDFRTVPDSTIHGRAAIAEALKVHLDEYADTVQHVGDVNLEPRGERAVRVCVDAVARRGGGGGIASANGRAGKGTAGTSGKESSTESEDEDEQEWRSSRALVGLRYEVDFVQRQGERRWEIERAVVRNAWSNSRKNSAA